MYLGNIQIASSLWQAPETARITWARVRVAGEGVECQGGGLVLTMAAFSEYLKVTYIVDECLSDSISSVSDLIEKIRIEREGSTKAIWFRGQHSSSWKLLPGLLREDFRMSESTLLARFKQSAAMLMDRRPETPFDWIFLMQHYGVPTRLLDWSENPLVAAYFALEKSQEKDEDAAFWILRPSELNKNANIKDDFESDYIPSFDDEEVSGYSTEQLRRTQRTKLFPIATIATRNNPRIQAQLGTFTIHHNEKIPIEDVGDKSHCKKYTIPSDAKSRLREEIAILGVNRFSLFPEIESIGYAIKEMI